MNDASHNINQPAANTVGPIVIHSPTPPSSKFKVILTNKPGISKREIPLLWYKSINPQVVWTMAEEELLPIYYRKRGL